MKTVETRFAKFMESSGETLLTPQDLKSLMIHVPDVGFVDITTPDGLKIWEDFMAGNRVSRNIRFYGY